MNFYLSIIALFMVFIYYFIIANPDISSINGASTFISFHSFGFSTIHSFGKMGKDLFRKLKQQSHEFTTPSNSNIFLIPRTKFTFSCILDTRVYISNLCPCISIIIGIMNKTLTYCLFSLCS